jgi:hypothetical protein
VTSAKYLNILRRKALDKVVVEEIKGFRIKKKKRG